MCYICISLKLLKRFGVLKVKMKKIFITFYYIFIRGTILCPKGKKCWFIFKVPQGFKCYYPGITVK